MGFGNLSDFSNTITTGRLLNHAFKKQEILQPPKMRLHDLCLKEIDNGWDIPYLAVYNKELHANFTVVVRSAGKRAYRVADEVVLEGELDVHGVFSRTMDQEGRRVSGAGTTSSVKIRADRLADYYALSMRFFFDAIYGISSLKMVDTHEKWHYHVFGVANRHKWKF